MDDLTKLYLIGAICVTLIIIVCIIVIGWVNSPFEITMNIRMDNASLEAFKIAYNCTGGI